MKKRVVFLTTVWGFTVVALVIDLISQTAGDPVFPRFGALLVVAAAVVEYGLATDWQSTIKSKPEGPHSVSEIAKAVLLTDEAKLLKAFAHVTLFAGTLIWGFGDLLV